ncbi:hypothetical protein BDV11DRAFT_174017 [Aspergillus similis]
MRSSVFWGLIIAAFAQSVHSSKSCPSLSGIERFGPKPKAGPSNGQFLSCASGFDGPKVQSVNETTYDWWYFDSINPNGNSSLAVVFFLEAPKSGFVSTSNLSSLDFVQISGSFPNGTLFSEFILADDAIISTQGDGANGNREGSGFSWSGAPDLSRYVVSIDSVKTGINGTFSLRSTAPPHYPCSPALPGQSLTVLPGVGWANGIPDADVTVNVQIGDTLIDFVGIGYHDKNWGVTPFTDSVGSWYWGHARMGPYSIVWLDALDTSKNEYASGYVAY